MGVKIDFSDVDSFFDKGMNDMQQTERKLAQDAVDYAKQMGTYKDVTGTLRNSNKFLNALRQNTKFAAIYSGTIHSV